MGVLAKKWKALARTKNRCKKGLPWITLHGKADSAMGMKDLKKNVPLVQTALEFAPQMMNKPRQIETEVSRLPLKPKSPKELASCMNFTNKWLNCKNIYIHTHACVYMFTQSQVKTMYEKMEWEVEDKQPYLDSWNIRRLVSYAQRRAKDCHRRGQTPRELWLQFHD